MEIPRFYSIESTKNTYESTKYRFRSLFNGMVGAWVYDKKEAIQDGKNHEQIVRFLYGKQIAE
jgi:hypothetical protein